MIYSFSNLINIAETITVNKRPIIASTTARDGTVRSVVRSYQPWRFEVKVPDGIMYRDIRGLLNSAENLQLSTFFHSFAAPGSAGHEWIFGYLGDATNTLFNASWIKGSKEATVTGGVIPSGGMRFRAGDIIQFSGTPIGVYTVVEDTSSTTVKLHRPIIEATGSGPTRVGSSCLFYLRCTSFPNWTLFGSQQVQFDAPFVFSEVFTNDY